jgi:cysteine desulfurase/selenocysteine lyase
MFLESKMKRVRKDFPVLSENPKLAYLDSTATSLKPREVIAKLDEYYEKYSSNIHRGVYALSEKATDEYEQTRREVASFMNANTADEVVFTKGTTESINIVANGLADILKPGDEIVTSVAEHHSNLVPWQELSKKRFVLKFLDINEAGELKFGDEDDGEVEELEAQVLGSFAKVVTSQTKVLALTYVSNVLGTINPLKKIISEARAKNPEMIIVIDAAQAAPHMKLDVYDLDADFLAFSAHKMLGPTGLGVLWGKKNLLNKLKPLNFGGDMIESVKISGTTYREAPYRFEGGTPPIAEVIAFKQALWYLQDLGLENIQKWEHELTEYALKKFQSEFGDAIRLLGTKNSKNRAGIISFNFKHYHPHDIAQIFDEENIAVRSGHHCAEVLHTRLGINASVRASYYIYNTKQDVDRLVAALKKVDETLK